MGYLGTPYRVIYQAKSFTSGYTDIVAVVKKPNGSIVGPFTLIEMASPFLGVYYFDLFTSSSDPAGEWFALVVSPTELVKDLLRISLYQDPSSSVWDQLLSAHTTVGTFGREIQDTYNSIASLSRGAVADFSMEIETNDVKNINIESTEFSMQVIPEEVIP